MCCQTMSLFGGPSLCSNKAVAQIGPTGLALGCCWIRSRSWCCWRGGHKWNTDGKNRKQEKERRSRWGACEMERKAHNTVTEDLAVRCSGWQHVWKHSNGQQQQLLWGRKSVFNSLFLCRPRFLPSRPEIWTNFLLNSASVVLASVC